MSVHHAHPGCFSWVLHHFQKAAALHRGDAVVPGHLPREHAQVFGGCHQASSTPPWATPCRPASWNACCHGLLMPLAAFPSACRTSGATQASLRRAAVSASGSAPVPEGRRLSQLSKAGRFSWLGASAFLIHSPGASPGHDPVQCVELPSMIGSEKQEVSARANVTAVQLVP